MGGCGGSPEEPFGKGVDSRRHGVSAPFVWLAGLMITRNGRRGKKGGRKCRL